MIYINNISKGFGSKRVIQNLNLTVLDSKITALIGANGCGKTTLIRLISGILKPDAGEIRISPEKKIGVLLGGDVSLYGMLTGYENLKFFAALHHMDSKRFHNRCDELAETLGFASFMNERAIHYSRGMTQRIAFAISILHDPEIILLDEPSTGLDIPTANDVINFVKYCKIEGKTILISTHNISEIADLSDYIAVMKCGSIQKFERCEDYFKDCINTEKINKLALDLEYDI